MKITDLAKKIIYAVLLFGLSAFLIFLRIYDENAVRIFSLAVFMCAAALLNGFSLIAVKKQNIFYAVSDLICLALWVYPLYKMFGDILPAGTGIWAYILLWTVLLPCAAGCLYTVLYCIIINRKKKRAGKKTLTAKKVISIICIAVTAVSAIAATAFTVKLGMQIPKDAEERKQSFSVAAGFADETAEEYKSSDLVIEEILNNRGLTYDNSTKDFYIIEEKDGICITIDASAGENYDDKNGVISVTSDSIGIGILNLFERDFYSGEEYTAVISE